MRNFQLDRMKRCSSRLSSFRSFTFGCYPFLKPKACSCFQLLHHFGTGNFEKFRRKHETTNSPSAYARVSNSMMDPRFDPDSVVNCNTEMAVESEKAQMKRRRPKLDSLRFREKLKTREVSKKTKRYAKKKLLRWKTASRRKGADLLGVDVPIVKLKRVFEENAPCDGCGIPLQSKDEFAPGYVCPLDEDMEHRLWTTLPTAVDSHSQSPMTTTTKHSTVATTHSSGSDVASECQSDLSLRSNLSLTQSSKRKTAALSGANENEVDCAIAGISKMEEGSEFESGDGSEEVMSEVYLPHYQRLTLMDLGIIDGKRSHLTRSELARIAAANKVANKSEKSKHIVEKAVCSRCYQLSTYGRARVAGGKHSDEIIPAVFRQILEKRMSDSRRKLVVIKVVDVCDFNGSFITDFDLIVNGPKDMDDTNDNAANDKQKLKKPSHYSQQYSSSSPRCKVILAVNKIDLLTDWVRKRPELLRNWALKESKRFGLIPDALMCISGKSGFGVSDLLDKALSLCPIAASDDAPAKERYRDIYVVGTANSGKSTLLNTLLKQKRIYSARNRQLTTSHVPGTTLATMPFLLPTVGNTRLIDTPGVIEDDGLYLRLTLKELEMLQPKTRLKPVNYKLKKGTSIILGTLGRLDFEDGLDFIFTVFVAPRCTVHVCNTEKAQETMLRLGGEMLRPVVGAKRVQAFLPFEKKHTYQLEGIGWQHSVCDVVFPGVGWIALTGCKNITFTLYGPKNYRVGIRRPLLPRDNLTRVRSHYSGIPAKKY